jgi:RND family efflux transporter MFP subunit
MRAEQASAEADARLAKVTSDRYSAIYARNAMLIAKQEVDEAQARSAAAEAKAHAAQGSVSAAKARLAAAKTAVEAAKSRVAAAAANRDAAAQASAATDVQRQEYALDSKIAAERENAAAAGLRRARAALLAERSKAGGAASEAARAGVLQNYTKIIAPFDGYVTSRYVDRGALLTAGGQNAARIVTISTLNRVRVTVYVPEMETKFLKPGGAAFVSLSEGEKHPVRLSISRISGALDPKTRTMLVEMDADNSKRTFTPGAYAVVKLVMETHARALAVPAGAVGSDKSGKYVYTVDGGKAHRAPVTVGFSDGAYTEVLTGLKGTENVVVDGRDNVTPNGPVTAEAWNSQKAAGG